MYISWKVRNPSAAFYDYSGETDSTQQKGLVLFVSWNDDVIVANPDRREGDTELGNVTGIVYVAVVGTQQTRNIFTLSYTDSGAIVKTGSMLMGLLTLLAICFQ
jgi:hypothetical protein